MSTSVISVVMPVYNGEQYLAQAIDSILSQTLENFEFIIIDDASTDRTHEMLEAYATKDQRIRIHRQPENAGVTVALNKGCQLAQGTFIARMDADDVSLPTRFERQHTFLLQHPEIGIVGTQIQSIDEYGSARKADAYPTHPDLVMWSMLFFDSLVHPSVMMRRELVEKLGYYDPNRRQSQDYDLWTRAIKVTQLANLPDILLLYRTWNGSVTTRSRQKQAQTSLEILQNHLFSLINTLVPVERIGLIQGLATERYPHTLAEIKMTADTLLQAHQAYLHLLTGRNANVNAMNLDIGTKLLLLAVLTVRHSPSYALSLAATGLRIAPLAAVRFTSKVAQKLYRKIQA